ncbi:hypothetical protein EDF60_1653 [Leucobacter luti]|nr:hypothetical protein [Leucobacter luti]TCK41228.1 hypothetical protein EDF60_1653 [Leucobacter luti]
MCRRDPWGEDLEEFPDPWDEADYLHDMEKEREVFGDV